jgi:phosphoglycolate phosphatase
MKETTLLFDLDGTLTDSAEGITKSVAAALSHFGIEVAPETLGGFIGPPLGWSFPHFFHLDAAQTDEAIEVFRERYDRVGKFENRVYDGIPEALTALAAAGYRLAVATSKPEHFAVEILAHFDLTRYFACIAGAAPDEKGGKREVIRDALHRMGDLAPGEALMIGDRLHDMDGAHAEGLRAVGALWGYGSLEELSAHGAEFLVRTPGELVSFLTASAGSAHK